MRVGLILRDYFRVGLLLILYGIDIKYEIRIN